MENNDSANSPLLLFWTGHFLYIGRGADTDVHEHHAIQIAISLNEPMQIITASGPLNLPAVIIDSDHQHQCRTHGEPFVLLNVDPETNIGVALKRSYLSSDPIAGLPSMMVTDFLHDLRPLLLPTVGVKEIFLITQKFLGRLANTPVTFNLDERVVKILGVLRSPAERPVKINQLANMVFMSPSRLIHLFTEQVGIPIRRYALWSRLLFSLHEFAECKNLTDAALRGGFSDAPHFNRTFKKMFGLNPGTLLKNSQIIQDYTS